MKKNELIDVILGYSNLGEMSKEELQKHTVKELNILKDEMDQELADEGIVKKDAFADILVPADEPGKSSEPEPEPEKFNSMCGFAFDPSAKSGCNTQCVIEFADSFAECKANFAVQPDKKSKVGSKPAGLGMNMWYHRPGTQGGLLDDFFTKGKVGTVAEIAEFAGCNQRRVMIHIKHLIFDFGVEILQGQKKDEDGKLVTAYFLKGKNKGRKGTEILGKTGFPNGYPKTHPLYQE